MTFLWKRVPSNISSSHQQRLQLPTLHHLQTAPPRTELTLKYELIIAEVAAQDRREATAPKTGLISKTVNTSKNGLISDRKHYINLLERSSLPGQQQPRRERLQHFIMLFFPRPDRTSPGSRSHNETRAETFHYRFAFFFEPEVCEESVGL